MLDISSLLPAARDEFFSRVWKIARLIPSGKVFTYGQIAALIPAPPGVPAEEYRTCRSRWAGNAMAACPKDVPWQRVINAQGKISPREGASLQRELLEQEGVVFGPGEKISLAAYGWSGPSTEWIAENGLLSPEQGPSQMSLF